MYVPRIDSSSKAASKIASKIIFAAQLELLGLLKKLSS